MYFRNAGWVCSKNTWKLTFNFINDWINWLLSVSRTAHLLLKRLTENTLLWQNTIKLLTNLELRFYMSGKLNEFCLWQPIKAPAFANVTNENACIYLFTIYSPSPLSKHPILWSLLFKISIPKNPFIHYDPLSPSQLWFHFLHLQVKINLDPFGYLYDLLLRNWDWQLGSIGTPIYSPVENTTF